MGKTIEITRIKKHLYRIDGVEVAAKNQKEALLKCLYRTE